MLEACHQAVRRRRHNSVRKALLLLLTRKNRSGFGGLNNMNHLFSINTEGGPLLCADTDAARRWKGSEAGSDNYEDLCARFDASPELAATIVTIGEHPAVAWEMSGPGTADVFRSSDGLIRIVRAWVDEDTPEELEKLASLDAPSHVEVGEIEIPSGLLAVLWAPESGQRIPLSTEHDVQRVSGTSLDDSAFLLKVSSQRYRCQHDEVNVGVSRARRLTLIPS